MYLISLYFDNKTNKRILGYIHNVAEKTGNTFMLEHNVPPHITISAFETFYEEEAVDALNGVMNQLQKGKIEWVTVGTFPTVIFIQPVLNEYLHHLSGTVYESISNIPDTKIRKMYRPFHWLPHATIGKQLSDDEMRKAFEVLQKSFGMFNGEIIRIELAKKNPFRIVASWELRYE